MHLIGYCNVRYVSKLIPIGHNNKHGFNGGCSRNKRLDHKAKSTCKDYCKFLMWDSIFEGANMSFGTMKCGFGGALMLGWGNAQAWL